MDETSMAGADRCGPNPFRQAAADVRRGWLDYLQPLLATGTPDEWGRDRDVQNLFRAARPRREGTNVAVELARPQGAPAMGANGRGHHGGGGIRVRSRDAVRYPRVVVWGRLRRAMLVRRADGGH